MASEESGEIEFDSMETGLNPCSCGRWLQSVSWQLDRKFKGEVLILVLVEDGFRVWRGMVMMTSTEQS